MSWYDCRLRSRSPGFETQGSLEAVFLKTKAWSKRWHAAHLARYVENNGYSRQQGWVKSFFFGSRSRSQNPRVQKGFDRSRSIFTGIAIPILMRSFSKFKITPSSGRKKSFWCYPFLEALYSSFNFQILNWIDLQEEKFNKHLIRETDSACTLKPLFGWIPIPIQK